MRPSDFWELTPTEFIRLAKNHIKKKQAEHLERMNLAVLTAFKTVEMYADARKHEIKLSDYLFDEKDFEPKPEQTPDEMLHAMALWNAACGGTVKRVKSGPIYEKYVKGVKGK